MQPLDVKERVWAADAEMLRGFGAAVPYTEVLEAEVNGLRNDRAARRR